MGCGCSSNFNGKKTKKLNARGMRSKASSAKRINSKGLSKFSNFLGKKSLLPKRNKKVDIIKHNISPEHYFEYNQRSFDYVRRTDDSFKNYNDLNHMDYEF